MPLDFAPMHAARKFLHGIIDYAGLFPPASLSMDEAVRAYASYLDGPDSDMLGRFVVPAARLTELLQALESSPVSNAREWRVSVIAGKQFVAACDASAQFNSASTLARCDSIEGVASSASDVEDILAHAPQAFETYIEVPVEPDPRPLVSAIAGSRAFAKIRTGGVTPEAMPSAKDVLRFMIACRDEGVPFKATAGLHHVVRSEYPLTYESNAPIGTMFGYLNIFLAAAALRDGSSEADVLAILEERDVSRFEIGSRGAIVSGTSLSIDALTLSRADFARSFGSCSFTEPVSEARALGLI